jgi:hypothetical protein
MSTSEKTMSNKWMVDLANSALKEVNGWPTWKKESFGIGHASKDGAKSSSVSRNSKKVA